MVAIVLHVLHKPQWQYNTTAIGVLITDTNSSVFTIMESTAASPRKGKKT
jgi:hypothetical protein